MGNTLIKLFTYQLQTDDNSDHLEEEVNNGNVFVEGIVFVVPLFLVKT